MVIKRRVKILFRIGFVILILSCNQKSIDENKLCYEFYQLNKTKSFQAFSDVVIGKGRVRNVYDKSSNQYELNIYTIGVYSRERNGYVSLPVFKIGATFSEKASVFNSCNQQTKKILSEKLNITAKDQLLYSYIEYINILLNSYYKIETPSWYNSKNVVVEGNPTLGKFITFTLNKNSKCYYLEDKRTLNPYWSKYFNGLKKLDSNWYYETND